MMFLKHIYSDTVKVEAKYIYELLSVSTTNSQLLLKTHSFVHFLQLADRFNVPSIKKRCEQILAQHITVESVCQIFKYANTFNCERLRETCLLFTEENHNDVITSSGFEDLDKEEIIQIIRLGNDSKKRKRKPQK